ncbi:MAG: STAS domain-containing protein [bacterium]
METIISYQGSWLIVELNGELDVATIPTSRAMIDQTLKEQQTMGLVLDLTKVKFMDSSGLGFILGRYRRLIEEGRPTILVGAQGQVNRVLKMSGLNKIIPQYLTVAEALAATGEVK